MRLNRKKIRFIIMLTVAAVFFCSFSVMARTKQEQGRLTIFYHGVTPQEENIALSGAEFSLYKVASYQKKVWIYSGDFSECQVPLTDMSASGQQKAAKSIYTYVREKNLKGIMKKTDVNGRTSYTDLKEAMYLIVPEEDVACSDGVFRSAPFLVRIPEMDNNGNRIHDVIVEPKSEWVSGEEPEKPQPPTEKPKPDPESNPEGDTTHKPGSSSSENSVKTGDDTPVSRYIILFVTGAVILFGIVTGKKKKENNLYKGS